VIKDRRRFTEGFRSGRKDRKKQQPEAASTAGNKKAPVPKKVSDKEEQAGGPLPEVTMATFIFSSDSSALYIWEKFPSLEPIAPKLICPSQSRLSTPWHAPG